MTRANDHGTGEIGEPREISRPEKKGEPPEPRKADEPQQAAGRGLLDAPSDERASGLPDLLRRLMTVGFTGLFTTEAAIRSALGDTVPQEWVDFIADQSERTRDEFISRLAQEFARVLESVDLVGLAEQMLEGRTLEVNAQFRLQPRDRESQARGAGRSARSQQSRDNENRSETRRDQESRDQESRDHRGRD